MVCALAVSLVCLGAPSAESPAPQPRTKAAITFDGARGELIVVGGAVDEGRGLPDSTDSTWLWNSKTWRRAPGRGPGARNEPQMVYDSKRARVVLFGGIAVQGDPTERPATLRDTWEWDGEKWEERANKGPSGRRGHAMAFDPERGAVLLFGGERASGLLGDTWEWNGEVWTKREVKGPSPRSGAVMAWDGSRKALLLFGGNAHSGFEPGRARPLGDLWQWTGDAWVELKLSRSPAPSPRLEAGWVFDANHQVMVLAGGLGSTCVEDPDTWLLDVDGWHRTDAHLKWPTPAQLVWDSTNSQVLGFGGRCLGLRAELLSWDGSIWRTRWP